MICHYLRIDFEQVENCPVTEYSVKLNLALNLMIGSSGGKFQFEMLEDQQSRAEREWQRVKASGFFEKHGIKINGN